MLRIRKALVLAVPVMAAGMSSANAAEAFSSQSRWMTGDWGGVRTALLDQGVDIRLGFTGESATLLGGGYTHASHPTRYADQFSVGLAIDLGKFAGWENTQFGMTVTNRNGQTLNEEIGDPRAKGLGTVQEIQGRGNVTRLSQLWLSKGWLDDTFNAKVGRMAASDDFATEECAFQNVAFCGSQPGNYVDTIYNGPISQWGIRLRYRLTPELFAQAGAYNVNPSNLENDNGFKLNGAGTTGTLLPVELVWQPMLNALPGEYRVGYFSITADAKDVYLDDQHLPAAATGNEYREHSRRDGWWMVAKQQLTSVGGNPDRGLTLTGSMTFQDRATTPVDSYQKVSLIYKGLFDARPLDAIGFGVARMHVSERFLRNAKVSNAENGVGYDDASYLPLQHSQYQAELNYRIHATGWLSIMPNLQYIKNPDGVREVDDALVFGLQVQSQF